MEWRDGQPYSLAYDDVYFASDANEPLLGIAETEYVFLKHNQLQERFASADNRFTIVETGFGSGLNFLCASDLWLRHASKDATLHFISIEKHPLSASDLRQIYTQWPANLANIGNHLLQQYNDFLHPTQHFLLFDGQIQLTLLIGDIHDMLKTLPQHVQPTADAWFLDGFAPSKNPDMWQHDLYDCMATHADDNTTFATFTSAGVVRRGLQAAGFHVLKTAGYGKKREMLYGQFDNQQKVLPRS